MIRQIGNCGRNADRSVGIYMDILLRDGADERSRCSTVLSIGKEHIFAFRRVENRRGGNPVVFLIKVRKLPHGNLSVTGIARTAGSSLQSRGICCEHMITCIVAIKPQRMTQCRIVLSADAFQLCSCFDTVGRCKEIILGRLLGGRGRLLADGIVISVFLGIVRSVPCLRSQADFILLIKEFLQELLVIERIRCLGSNIPGFIKLRCGHDHAAGMAARENHKNSSGELVQMLAKLHGRDVIDSAEGKRRGSVPQCTSVPGIGEYCKGILICILGNLVDFIPDFLLVVIFFVILRD